VFSIQLKKCPLPLRQIAQCLQDAILNKFPESNYSVIGGFYFLRFLCPAIVSPDGFKIVTNDIEITPEVRRVLVLVSKVVQSIANEKEFNEDYMSAFNQLVMEYKEVTSYFCNTLSKVPPPNSVQNDFVPSYEILWETYIEDLEFIKSIVLPKIDQIKEEFSLTVKESRKKREVILNLLQDIESHKISQLPTVIESDKTPRRDVFIKAKPIKTFKQGFQIGFISNHNINDETINHENNVSDTNNNNLNLENLETNTNDTQFYLTIDNMNLETNTNNKFQLKNINMNNHTNLNDNHHLETNTNNTKLYLDTDNKILVLDTDINNTNLNTNVGQKWVRPISPGKRENLNVFI